MPVVSFVHVEACLKLPFSIDGDGALYHKQSINDVLT